MRAVSEYAAFIMVSAILAVSMICYRWSYLGREKQAIMQILSRQKRILPLTLCAFIVAACCLLRFKSGTVTYIYMIQLLLLWDIVFIIASIDHLVKKIPNLLLIVLIAIRFAGIAIEALINGRGGVEMLVFSLTGAVVGGAVILTGMLISRGGVGMGDLKLYAVTGLFIGLSGILQVLMYSLFLAAVYSVILLVSGKAKLRSTLPMAPFVLGGISVYYFFL